MRNLILIILFAAIVAGCEKVESKAPTSSLAEDSVSAGISSQNGALLEKLEEAVENENFEAALAAVNVLKGSADAAVRLRCVESIGWFGAKSAKVLTPFLIDSSEDVRSEAQDQWDSAVNEIEDERERGSLVDEAMTIVRDRDVMDVIASQLNDLPPTLSIDIIVNHIAGSNGVARAAAKEAYEFVTGDEWKSAAAAQKWLEENQDEEDDE